MRSSASLALLLPLAVSASPLSPQAVNALFCRANKIVLTVLTKDASATKYCSSFLGIPTSTIMTTVTETPSSVTTTVPYTTTGPAVTQTDVITTTSTETATTTTTDVRTAYATITQTTSTSTITCLNSAYTYTAPVGVVPAAAAPAEGDTSAPAPEGKRGIPFVNKPNGIPKEWSNKYISTACSCLSIPTPSTTSTVTQTLVPGTVTETSTEIVTPTETTQTTTTVPTTSTTTLTETTTTTSTLTAYAIETTIASNGLQYRKYTHSFDANEATGGGFTSSYFKPLTPDFSGTTTSLTFASPNWPNGRTTLTLSDGRAFASDQSALLMQGFFIARETGVYQLISLGSDIDNYGYAWTGDVAYANWNDGNTAFQSRRTGGGSTTGMTALRLNKGDAVPVSYLWANGGGVAQNVVRVRTPGGVEVRDHTGYFVKACSAEVFQ